MFELWPLWAPWAEPAACPGPHMCSGRMLVVFWGLWIDQRGRGRGISKWMLRSASVTKVSYQCTGLHMPFPSTPDQTEAARTCGKSLLF